MIISQARELDRNIRMNVLRIIGVAARRGDMERVKTFSAESLRLKRRIESHDYTVEDEAYKTLSNTSPGFQKGG